ncbi:LysR family transcriptional regulator [Kutzneria sp. CA-103260]|uniref:LysR family transcriptional regulator n=1 Tax=Kutzneria sp. CA-103260 TaxID=2802641 RepID=UPI001BA48F17|nr:LysR family transcriptional regulator [Kutzneria sp. CA-103260]QUQ66126.1 LysR family transcriptional regulator [Kutzneria sp. CA-103260]
MTLAQLRALLAVVEHGGFTAAADRVGMSQPAVSRSVSALEAELGAPLLTRGRDGVSPTEAGEVVVRHAREVLRHFDLMRTEVTALAGEITGTLRLASLPTATGTLIASQLRLFRKRYPRVAVRLLEGSDHEVRDWLDQGVVDAGVVTLPAPGMRTVPLDTHEMVALVPADHRLATAETVTYEELSREPFIRSTGGCARVFNEVAATVGVRLGSAFEAREPAAVVEMVGAGLGVSILPTVGLPVDLSDVVTRPLSPRTVRELAVAISASAAPAARALLEQIAGG